VKKERYFAFFKQRQGTQTKNLLLGNVAPLGHVNTVEELTDILVLHSCGLLDVGSGLGDLLNVVSGQNELVLGGSGDNSGHSLEQVHNTDHTLSEEVTDLNGPSTLVGDNVDGEVSVHVTHLVLKTLKEDEEWWE